MLRRIGRPESKARDELDTVKKVWNAEVEDHSKAAEGYFKEVCRWWTRAKHKLTSYRRSMVTDLSRMFIAK